VPKTLTELLPGQKSYIVGIALFVVGLLKLVLPDASFPIDGNPVELMGMGIGIITLRLGIKEKVSSNA
jgi:NAD/NADP transhydrogenase beta subunit